MTESHKQCPICSGEKVLSQSFENGFAVEIDASSCEMTVWQGDTCLITVSIAYCPTCGAKLIGGKCGG